MAGLVRPARAQSAMFFRIGTAGTGGTYYPVGALIADAISAPPGTRTCARIDGCGVPGMVASAVATGGSVANVRAIQSGALESGLVQADIAAFAQTGTGIWRDEPPARDLRAIANLYPDLMHIVVADHANIATIADLRGKRIAMGERDSGTLADARLILESAGLPMSEFEASFLPVSEAAEGMQQGRIDAIFFVGAPATAALAELSSQIDTTLLPIPDDLAQRIIAEYPFFTRDSIPAATYAARAKAVPTISVGAQWLTSAAQPEGLIHDITRALWSNATKARLLAGSPRGRSIILSNALRGVTIPLHPGAARFYRNIGLIR